MSSMEIARITKETLKKMFAEGKRFDGRGVFDYRPLEVAYNVSNKAEGSARVRLGKSEVVVGVKMTVGEPYPDSPEKGNLSVSGDLLPLASPRYESGPPGFDAVELPRLVDRAIRHSGLIDFTKLVIVPGEKVWTVLIDVYPINDDGNMIDAATIGAFAALRKTIIPKLDESNCIDYDQESDTPLPIDPDITPLSFSFFKLGGSLILDPTREEEEACDTRITFGMSSTKTEKMVNSCQKKGEAILTIQELENIAKIMPEKYDELSKKLKKFL